MYDAFRRAIFGLLAILLWQGTRANAALPPRLRQQVIPMTIADGDPQDPGRVFAVPVTCDGIPAHFELGCYGPTRISRSFAEKCRASILFDSQLDQERDPQGKPIFDGVATVSIEFAGVQQEAHAPVMRDECCQKPEKEGLLGFDVMSLWQWEVDPAGPTLTLRPPGTPPAKRPLAILPVRITPQGYYLHVRIRNVSEELAITPASSYVQAGVKLQRAWDLNSGKPLKLEVKRFGNVRTFWLSGQDMVELSPMLKETDLSVALMGDPKKPHPTRMEESCLGQCVLNRFVYCLEPKREQVRIIARVK